MPDFPVDFPFKTKPYDHQLDCLNRSHDKPYFALFAEQGTGKTKITLDTAAYLFKQNKIDSLLLLAPNGAQWNWILNEIPTHLPLKKTEYAVHVWENKKTKKYNNELTYFFDRPGTVLKIFLMNIEAVSSGKGFEWVKSFLQISDCLFVIDESTIIKNHQAKRTKKILSIASLARYRRILTGTPITNGLVDVYCPIQFLSPDIFRQKNWYVFRSRYARLKQIPQAGGRYVTVIDGYKDGAISEVKAITAPISFWATKSECLNLPKKIYKLHYAELSSNQLATYNSMATSMIAVHGDEYVQAEIALTKFLRLQQIIGGFFPVTGSINDEGDSEWTPDKMVELDKDGTPKLKRLLDIIELSAGKSIIWAEYKPEIAMISYALKAAYGSLSVVEYHGGVGKEVRKDALHDFQNSDTKARFLIAHVKAAGRSHTLHRAEDVIYYSNSHSLEMRQQSEDRVHRSGLKHPVTYHDIEAVKGFASGKPIRTLDYKIIDCLRNKKKIADEFRGGQVSDWI